jgi:predicted nucleic acid-binding protein
MSLLVDTSILIRLQKGESYVRRLLERLTEHYPSAPSITFVNVFEYMLGIEQWTRKKREAQTFLRNFNIINTTEKTAEIMTSLRIKYDKKGLQFSLADLIIASLTVENRMVLVTSDKDFKEIEELELEFVD